MVLIIGAGIAGLTTAIALQQKGIDFLVFEAVPEIKPVGAGISLAANAMLVLQKLGISEEVKRNGHSILSMAVQDENGKRISFVDSQKFKAHRGMENVAIHRGELHRILISHIDQSKIITNKRAAGFVECHDHVSVSFEDGSTCVGSAVIVADGIHSVFRKKLIPNSLPRYSGYTCWRGIVKNIWNLSQSAVEIWGAAGRFGFAPIGNNQVYWFACKNAQSKDANMMRWNTETLAVNFQSFAQPVSTMIRNTPASELIWSDISDLEPPDQLAFGKVVLIGDAGHATTPNLGQGACMGIEDALVISEELAKTNSVEIAFQTFEQKRLRRTCFIVNTSYRLGKIAQLENKILIAIRNTLFRCTPAVVHERQVAQVLNIDNL